MQMWKEFKDFAIRGNVVDLAVGLIIGGAFTKLVNSLVTDLLMPPLGLLVGSVDLSEQAWVLKGQAGDNPEVMLRYGLFVNNIIDFILMAFAMFIVVKQINRMKRSETPPPPTSKTCPYCVTVVDAKATRCPNCTSTIAAASA